MAGAANTDDEDEAAVSAPPAPKKKGGAGVSVLIVAIVLSAAASAGVSWLVSSRAVHAALNPAPPEEEAAEDEPEIPSEPANYLPLDPAFVVNLDDEHSQRFLQVQVEVMSRDTKTIEQVQRHAPRIRSSLLLLFGQQRAEDLSSRAGKEKLQADVLAEIQNILRAETGKDDVEAVYFTSFVMQ